MKNNDLISIARINHSFFLAGRALVFDSMEENNKVAVRAKLREKKKTHT